VDGVIAVDPQAVASMLQITGPVTARGVTITADDAAQFFTVDVYAQYPDGQERDEVSMALVEATVEALLAAEWDPFVLAEALQAPVEQERVLVWSANADEQGWLEQTVLGGVLPNQPGSVVAVAFNNSAANKTDAFVAASVEYRPGRNVTASPQKSSLRVKLRNDAPADLPGDGLSGDNYGYFVDPSAPRGTTRMLVHVYAPVGANYQAAQVDGVDTPLYLGSERNRPVWWTYLELPRDQERVLDVTFEEPTVLGVEPRVIPQAMVIPEVIQVIPNPNATPGETGSLQTDPSDAVASVAPETDGESALSEQSPNRTWIWVLIAIGLAMALGPLAFVVARRDRRSADQHRPQAESPPQRPAPELVASSQHTSPQHAPPQPPPPADDPWAGLTAADREAFKRTAEEFGWS